MGTSRQRASVVMENATTLPINPEFLVMPKSDLLTLPTAWKRPQVRKALS
jgi:hypothetical protein